MTDQQKEPNALERHKKGFWNKAEQVSRVYHNVIDGSFKLVIMIGIVVALILGAGVYYKTTSGIDTAKNWGCEYINPFCDTESETARKTAKAQAKEDVKTAKAAKVADTTEEPSTLSNAWGKVTGWFGTDEASTKP